MVDEQLGAAGGQFKPNIYPIMYWALAFGVIAGSILFIVYLLSRYITIIWFPVFLVGVIWGGYRNYQKQKQAWSSSQGTPPQSKTPVQEFREAVGDIVSASREMMAEQAPTDEQTADQIEENQEPSDQDNQPPVPPTPPPLT